MSTPSAPRIRLLVVDDSAYNRRNIADIFLNVPEVEVIGKAADGEEALRLTTLLKPDVITLDLEMPRMDGFTFLRILMSRQPTPVIVVSSYSQKENVFKALELGALDFVTKPDRQITPDATELREQILSKVLVVKNWRPQALVPHGLRRPAPSGPWTPEGGRPTPVPAPPVFQQPRQLVAIASSTGGPSALLEIFSKVPPTSGAGIVVAQHMPDKFTRTFAERLDRRGPVRTSEAQDGDRVGLLTGFVCPGRQCMEVIRNNSNDYVLRVGPGAQTDRYVPSADRLLKSAASAARERCIGVVLTGMGDDGVEGARAIFNNGGTVIAESQETAVVYGMPAAAVRAGVVHKVLPLPAIAEFIAGLP
ncbi:chemotaxis-specific protein-glutamate methyltransferase CheB [Pendulispora albinea]|uniref:Protein-glutamate methylesterase/protein-glutamine glutaminase n=1 Tax=Pendulispora albinea TaxID=2741071 RepID=A0ABZ2M3M6_9BACT